MIKGVFIAWTTAATLAFCAEAQAASTYTFQFNGPGVSGEATVTVAPNGVGPADPNPLCGTAGNNPCRQDPPGALKILDISGTFTDTNNGLTIMNAAITGLVPINPANERDLTFDPAVPASLSFFDWTNEPTIHDALSYDNLFFPGGNPIDCDYPFSGTLLDPFGMMFTIAGGDTVGMWGYGNVPGNGLAYGVAVTDGVNEFDYTQFPGNIVLVPEPSTWAMMIAGLAGLGFAGYRSSRKGAQLAA
jgi:hypothetical protein